jgi:polar amino acid transport system permease protein
LKNVCGAASSNWHEALMDWSWIPKYWPLFVSGLTMTCLVLACSMVFGILLAIPLGYAQVAGPKWVRWLANGYCTVIRGTPLLLQLYLFYFGLGSIFASYPELRQSMFWPILREGLYYAIVAFSLNVAGYVGEVLRGAFLTVSKGELEAARAFGMTPGKVFSRVWLPRALRNALPGLGTETILTLKSTPLVALVTVMDLFGASLKVRQDTYIIYEPLLVLLPIYMVLTFIIVRIFGYFENQIPVRR